VSEERDSEGRDRERREPDGDDREGGLLQTGPALARLAVGAGLRTARWAAETSLRTGAGILGVELPSQNGARPPEETGEVVPSAPEGQSEATQPRSLRERGAELLERSADVEYEEEFHPAYERILSQLAPDEARILRLLARRGPQPAVDVRTSKALGIGSEMVAPGLNMIGLEAGCRYLDRVPAYLNNLYRLGLIWFSREPLEDPTDYQVLEAQPDVIEAKRKGGRAKTVRRSISLTPFGEDFCRVALPLT
jgi:abortive infection alpha-like protein